MNSYFAGFAAPPSFSQPPPLWRPMWSPEWKSSRCKGSSVVLAESQTGKAASRPDRSTRRLHGRSADHAEHAADLRALLPRLGRREAARRRHDQARRGLGDGCDGAKSDGIRGQVTARGGIVYIPRTVLNGPTATATPSPANSVPAGNSAGPRTATQATRPTRDPVSPESDFVQRPASSQPKIINGRRYFWVPTSAGSNLGRWMPESVARPVRSASPSPRPTIR